MKQFKNLKQLDRIEYLLAERKLKENFIDFQPFNTLFMLLKLLIFITAFAILLAYHNLESARTIINIIPILWLITKWSFAILLSLQIISYIFYFRSKRKLKEYFKLNKTGGK